METKENKIEKHGSRQGSEGIGNNDNRRRKKSWTNEV